MTLSQQSTTSVAASSLAGWNAHPIVYEINTWVWLNDLGLKYARPVTLANVPEAELEDLASWGFDAIWLMGVWHRGKATRLSALNYLHEYRQALPDVCEADVPGSAYAIRDYQVEARLGGRAGLGIFRQRLREHGIKLVLDFVPNHVATDHAWLLEHPEYFVQGTLTEARQSSIEFFIVDSANRAGKVIACGRDPFFPPWIDTAQLNAFHPGLRQALVNTLIDIGGQCDGIRCDMAMLMMNSVFQDTWGERAGVPPHRDFWTEVIPEARRVHPEMLFLAEVYWDLEHEMLLQGFDFTYDKGLYDRVVNQDIGAIKAHLQAEVSYLSSNMRFIENHDEERVMTVLGEHRQMPAATLVCTLPGAVLLHQGQLTGQRIKLPVQISRRPEEVEHPLLARFYRVLLREASHDVYRNGGWQLLDMLPAYAGERTYHNIIAYCWFGDGSIRLIVLNLTDEWSRGYVALPENLSSDSWQIRLYDILSDTYAVRAKSNDSENALLLAVAPYGAHIFHVNGQLESATSQKY